MDTFKPESLKHDRAFSLIQSVSKSNATGAHTFRLQSTLTELMNSGYIESVKQLRETLLIQEWHRGRKNAITLPRTASSAKEDA
eukprot:scaffold77460_cov18-Tisochrysis_lutea.AAC.1